MEYGGTGQKREKPECWNAFLAPPDGTKVSLYIDPSRISAAAFLSALPRFRCTGRTDNEGRWPGS